MRAILAAKSCLLLSALTAGLLFAVSGCVYWPREPYADALATPPGPLTARLEAVYPGARPISPMYRRHFHVRGRYRVESQFFLFRDRDGQAWRGALDADARFTTHQVWFVDALPARLRDRFFRADAAAARGGQIVGQAWVFTEIEPIYEFEFQVPQGRGIGRINASATALSSYMLRAPEGGKED